MTSNLILLSKFSLLLTANSPYSELHNSLETTFTAGFAIIGVFIIVLIVAVILAALGKINAG